MTSPWTSQSLRSQEILGQASGTCPSLSWWTQELSPGLQSSAQPALPASLASQHLALHTLFPLPRKLFSNLFCPVNSVSLTWFKCHLLREASWSWPRAGPLVVHPPALGTFVLESLSKVIHLCVWLSDSRLSPLLPYKLHENRKSAYFNSFTTESTVLGTMPGTK